MSKRKPITEIKDERDANYKEGKEVGYYEAMCFALYNYHNKATLVIL